MNKIRLDSDDIKHITLFESMTGAKVRDFIKEDDLMCFMVNTGQMGLAIGKKGSNVERVRKALQKNILVLEFDEDAEKFMKNLFYPIEIHGLSIDNTPGALTATIQIQRMDKSRAVGQNGSRIKVVRSLAKRHHGIDEINLRAV